MAASTVTGQEILFKMAEEMNEVKGDFVTAVTNSTQFTVAGLANATNTYRYGLGRILGKGITVVTAQDANGNFTVSPAFSSAPTVGETFSVCWWKGKEQARAIEAANDAILISYPYWYRETKVDQSTATITLSAATDSYALPTDVDALIAVGIQLSASRPIRWFGPYLNKTKVWSVEGQKGAYTIRFAPRFARIGFHEMYATQKLCLWYATREPLLTALSSTGGTTQLPLEYFKIAAEIYRRRELNDANRRDLQVASVNLPQLQQMAQAELQRLMVGKRPPNLVMLEAQTDNPMEIALAMGMNAEDIAGQMAQPQKGKKQ
jgi:hypothetical protein